jgi:hypothetical protein
MRLDRLLSVLLFSPFASLTASAHAASVAEALARGDMRGICADAVAGQEAPASCSCCSYCRWSRAAVVKSHTRLCLHANACMARAA